MDKVVKCPCGLTFKSTLTGERCHKRRQVHVQWFNSVPWDYATVEWLRALKEAK